MSHKLCTYNNYLNQSKQRIYYFRYPNLADNVANVAIHGAAGGVSSVIQGGKFQSGFLAAGFSEFAGPHINKMDVGVVGKGVASAMVGGVASQLGGGKFENGAITSAFQYMYNHSLHFNGKNVEYRDDDGNLVATYPATSGRNGVTDFTKENEGPIPEGKWSLDPKKISHANGLRYIFRNSRGDWGHYRVPLEPSQSTILYNRRDFYMHGGKYPGTAGCIDVGKNEAALFPEIQKHDGPISLEVKYDGFSNR